MTSTDLAGFAGAILSVAIAYIPGFESWFANQPRIVKLQVLAGLLTLAALIVVGISCVPAFTNLLPAGWVIACTSFGITEFVKIWLTAFFASQATFVALPNKSKQIAPPAA